MAAAGSNKKIRVICVIRVPIPSAFLFAEHVRLGDSRNMAAAGSNKNPRHLRHPRSKKIHVIRLPIPSAFLFAEHVRLGDSRNMAAAGSIKNPRHPRHPRSKKICVIRVPIPSAFHPCAPKKKRGARLRRVRISRI
jgi:hypothetical protein